MHIRHNFLLLVMFIIFFTPTYSLQWRSFSSFEFHVTPLSSMWLDLRNAILGTRLRQSDLWTSGYALEPVFLCRRRCGGRLSWVQRPHSAAPSKTKCCCTTRTSMACRYVHDHHMETQRAGTWLASRLRCHDKASDVPSTHSVYDPYTLEISVRLVFVFVSGDLELNL